MKVRIGVAIGGRQSIALEEFGNLVDELKELGFDSIWVPETFLNGSIDPLVGLAFAAARVRTPEARDAPGRSRAEPVLAGQVAGPARSPLERPAAADVRRRVSTIPASGRRS